MFGGNLIGNGGAARHVHRPLVRVESTVAAGMVGIEFDTIASIDGHRGGGTVD